MDNSEIIRKIEEELEKLTCPKCGSKKISITDKMSSLKFLEDRYYYCIECNKIIEFFTERKALEDVLRGGDFPNFKTYMKAKEWNINNYAEYLFYEKYGTIQIESVKEKYLSEISEKIKKKNQETYIIDYKTFLQEILTDDIHKYLYDEPLSVLDDLKAYNKLSGEIEVEKDRIILNYPTNQEKEITIDYVSRIRENIPISIDRIAEKTKIKKERLENGIEYLIKENFIHGRYLELEGVFIKRPKPSTDAISVEENNYTCNICKIEGYIANEELAWCPSCVNTFHKAHILEWIKIQGKCPVCQEQIKEEDLVEMKLNK